MSAESTIEIEKITPRDTPEIRAANLEANQDLNARASANPHPEYQYLKLMSDIMVEGDDRAMHVPGDQGIRCMLGFAHRYDLRDGLPLLTTKNVHWKGVSNELLWFLKPETNILTLVNRGVNIWNDDAFKRYQRAVKNGLAVDLTKEEYLARLKADPDFAHWGDLGPIYGSQWRRWKNPYGGEFDQVAWLIKQLRDPVQRYRKSIMVSAWNPSYLPEIAPNEREEMALPPCHVMFQVDVDERERLTLMMYQRSADMFLGVPYNIASYAFLTHMLAQVCSLEAYQLIHFMGNAHVYHSHFGAVQEQLTREPLPFPKLVINPDVKEIDDFRVEDFELKDYKHHPKLKAEMIAVGGRIDDPVELKK